MQSFILRVPKWNGKIVFDYATISFIAVIAMLVVGMTLCFMGYKYLQTLCLMAIGCLLGMLGIRIGDVITTNPVIKMSFFVMFIFLGMCLCYMISILIVGMCKKLHMQYFVSKWKHLISAIFGAAMVSIVTYLQVYNNILVAVGLFVVLVTVSAIVGKKQAEKRRPFYTYNDLYQRKPLLEKGENAC